MSTTVYLLCWPTTHHGTRYPSSSSSITTTSTKTLTHKEPEILPQIIHEVIYVNSEMTDQAIGNQACTKMRMVRGPVEWPCDGILVTFPEGKNEHTSYPFGLHSEHAVPWNYQSIDNSFYIQAKLCQKFLSKAGTACKSCLKLTSSTLFKGIVDRIKFGAHENIPLVYHGVRGLMAVARRKTDQLHQLQLSKFNNNQKLMVKVGALEDHKQWILAIASGQVDHVASLVQVGLKHRAGIKALVLQYEPAADKLYQPKGYSNEDIMHSIFLLWLGGAHIAEFAHHSLSLPSLTTICCNTILQALVVSPSIPTATEIEANIKSCYTLGPSTTPNPESLVVTHQIIMLDELAVEKRV